MPCTGNEGVQRACSDRRTRRHCNADIRQSEAVAQRQSLPARPTSKGVVRCVTDEADIALRRWRTDTSDRRRRQLAAPLPGRTGRGAFPQVGASKTDEEIVDLWGASDDEYKILAKQEFGLDVIL